MKITKVCNVLSTQEFESKDKTKKFHHATLVGDDIVIKCQFIKEENYNLLNSLGHLAEVEVDFNVVQSGTDSNGNAVFSFRLVDARQFVKTDKKSTPFIR